MQTAPMIDRYGDFWDRTHDFVKKNAPFTHIVYRSLIPEREDDWIEVASKVFDFAVLQFFSNLMIGGLFAVFLPFIPLLLDCAWQGYRLISTTNPPQLNEICHTLGILCLAGLGIGLLQVHLPSPV